MHPTASQPSAIPVIQNALAATANPKTERLLYLDALRALAMINVVVVHAAMSFAVKAPAGWAALDDYRNMVFDVFIFLAAGFTMQLFFLLSGFFTAQSISKQGIKAVLASRFFRIVVPLLVGMVTIIPLLQLVGLYGSYRKNGAVNNQSFLDMAREFFTSGAALTNLNLGHLWFLLYLTLITLAVTLFQKVWNQLQWAAKLPKATNTVLQSSWMPLWLTIPTTVLMLPMEWMIDTPSRILPEWHIVLYYAFFFCAGVVFARKKEILNHHYPRWKRYLSIALLLVLPLTLGLLMASAYAVNMRQSPFYFAAMAGCALFAWLMILGLMGLFHHRMGQPSKKLRYFFAASYWIYLAHFPLVLYFQVLVMHWQVGAFVKFLLITVTAFALLLASYELLVRRTLLGVMLNGRKKIKNA